MQLQSALAVDDVVHVDVQNDFGVYQAMARRLDKPPVDLLRWFVKADAVMPS